jgi:hypothetical protein
VLLSLLLLSLLLLQVFLQGDDAEEVNKDMPGLTGESSDSAAAAAFLV